MTSQKINSESLANKPIGQKCEILGKESSIIANHSLQNYYNNDIFDLKQRHLDLGEEFFDSTFKFSPNIFNFSPEEISRFRKQQDLIKENIDLSNLLHVEGKNFLVSLEKDPKNKELQDTYKQLLENQ